MKRTRIKAGFRILLWTLFCLAALSACSDGDNTSTDGDDAPDGDAETDGDGPDGDTDGDSDTADGDSEDAEVEDEAESDEEWNGEGYPPPEFVFEVRTPPAQEADTLFSQEFPDKFWTADRLPSLDVRVLAAVNGMVYAGTPEGLYVKAPQQTEFIQGSSYGAVVDIADQTYSGKTVVAFDAAVLLKSETSPPDELLEFPAGGIIAVSTDRGVLAVATTGGVYVWKSETWEFVLDSDGYAIRDMLLANGEDYIYLATDEGLVSLCDCAFQEPIIDEHPARKLSRCGENKYVLALEDGLGMYDQTGEQSVYTMIPAEKEALPTDDLLDVTCDESGEEVLIGHATGATLYRLDGAHTDHYVSRRWIADDRVPAVALGADGGRWLGTGAGATRIHIEERTLAEKETVFDATVPYFFRMDGFVASDGGTADPEDDWDALELHDKDNDGLWTQMMIGGWCFAYAATGEEKYYQYARKAMDNMFLQIDIPAVDFEAAGMNRGFITRSLVRDDEGAVYSDKSTRDNWHPVTYEGHDYYWKDDTSSDELAGHYFGFPVFYDLCAKTDEEREEVASYAADLARYIIEGDYVLIDLDGERTFHGHWNPETISIAVDDMGVCMENGYSLEACAEARYGGGWLNSLEILGHMLAAYHMTGDEAFYDAYLYLADDNRYSEVAMASEETLTIVNPSIANHSDHELAMLAYTTLIRYEAHPERRARWIESLDFLYEYERPERNPWWAAVQALSGGADPAAADAVRTLREIPDDLREWGVNNSHRKDAELIAPDRFGDDQVDRVFPFDEIRTMWWNGNPYELVTGGDGRGRQAPTAWLLPYYMGLYSGLIVPAE